METRHSGRSLSQQGPQKRTVSTDRNRVSFTAKGDRDQTHFEHLSGVDAAESATIIPQIALRDFRFRVRTTEESMTASPSF